MDPVSIAAFASTAASAFGASAATAATVATGVSTVGSVIAGVGSFLGPVLSIAGPLLSAGSSYQQGQAAQQQAQINSQQALRQSQQVEVSGSFDLANQRRRNQLIVSQQLANIGASGVRLSGGAANLVARSVFEQEMDVLAMKYNTALKSSDLITESQNHITAGKQAASTGRANAVRDLMGLAPTLLGGR